MLKELAQLERQLRKDGHRGSAGQVHAIRREIGLMAKPPSWFARVSARLWSATHPQWRRLIREMSEMREAVALVERRLREGAGALSDQEREELRAQVADVLKAVPGSAILVGMLFVPLPGAQALSPFILHRLGLLPSAWRESYLLDALDEAVRALRADGAPDLLDRFRRVAEQIRSDAEDREEIRQFVSDHPEFFVLFDGEFDGKLTPEDLAHAQEALDELRAVASKRAQEPIWYAFLGDAVHGPHRLNDLAAPVFVEGALVSYERSGRWAPLRAVLDVTTP